MRGRDIGAPKRAEWRSGSPNFSKYDPRDLLFQEGCFLAFSLEGVVPKFVGAAPLDPPLLLEFWVHLWAENHNNEINEYFPIDPNTTYVTTISTRTKTNCSNCYDIST